MARANEANEVRQRRTNREQRTSPAPSQRPPPPTTVAAPVSPGYTGETRLEWFFFSIIAPLLIMFGIVLVASCWLFLVEAGWPVAIPATPRLSVSSASQHRLPGPETGLDRQNVLLIVWGDVADSLPPYLSLARMLRRGGMKVTLATSRHASRAYIASHSIPHVVLPSLDTQDAIWTGLNYSAFVESHPRPVETSQLLPALLADVEGAIRAAKAGLVVAQVEHRVILWTLCSTT